LVDFCGTISPRRFSQTRIRDYIAHKPTRMVASHSISSRIADKERTVVLVLKRMMRRIRGEGRPNKSATLLFPKERKSPNKNWSLTATAIGKEADTSKAKDHHGPGGGFWDSAGNAFTSENCILTARNNKLRIVRIRSRARKKKGQVDKGASSPAGLI
jgi:hypothetical protein